MQPRRAEPGFYLKHSVDVARAVRCISVTTARITGTRRNRGGRLAHIVKDAVFSPTHLWLGGIRAAFLLGLG